MRYHVPSFIKRNWRVREWANILTASLLAGLLTVFGLLPAGQTHAAIGDACPTLFTEYSVPTTNSNPYNMANGLNDEVWFSELTANSESHSKLGRVSSNGTITEVPVAGSQQGFAINDVVKGSDNNMWFSALNQGVGSVGYVDSQDNFTVFNLGSSNYPGVVIADPSDGVWVTVNGPSPGGKISHISSTGSRTDFPVNGLPETARPGAITWGPDGAIWFLYEGSDVSYPDGSVESLGVGVGRMTTAGQTTLYPLSNVPRSLQAITAGPDGALWFTAYRTHQIGRITTAGQVSEYNLDSQARPFDLKTSPSGELWASDAGTESILRITTSPFSVDSFYVPTAESAVREIAFSGNSVWATEQQSNKIARMTVPTGPVFAAPTNLTSPNPTDHPALSWNATAGATSYIVCRDGVQVATSTTPNYTDNSSLTAGAHTYAVVGVNAQGQLSGTSAPLVVQVYVDTTPPTITAERNPAPNSFGWNNTNVTVSFTCTDDIAVASCPASSTVSSQGAGQQVSGTATDTSGNSATASTTVNIDKTVPTVSGLTLNPAFILFAGNMTISANAADQQALSGIDRGRYYIDVNPTTNPNAVGTDMTYNAGTGRVTATKNFAIGSLTNGLHTIYVRTFDKAGNASSVVSAQFIYFSF